jgi:alkanesulfonate monooxygenase SsuD/methylene tetrahydromethanopterin reductase-like flavin-dependent oxidoreductase (luciferase family)
MLGAAGRVADGLYVGTGVTTEDVLDAKERIAAGAASAGRPAPCDLWWVTRFAVADSRDEAIARVEESLSSMGNHALRGDPGEKRVPRDLRRALAQYHERYDWARKNPLAGGRSPNAELMTELGLREYFLERFGIVGTPVEIVERLRELAARGVERVVLTVGSREELDVVGERILPLVLEREEVSDEDRAPLSVR